MSKHSIIDAFARYWWTLLVRGVVAVLFGVGAIAAPGLALLTLVLLFGAFAFADGLMAIWLGVVLPMWSLILLGVVGIAAGVYTFISPGAATAALLLLIASWAMVRGLFEIVSAIRLRTEITGEWRFIVGGIVSILFGAVLFANQAASALAMV